MSNIIVLSGSPRKGGNTDLLVDAFVKGAEKNNNVEVVSVADYKVNSCIGCNSCFDRAGHECFQQDDMQVVYDKLKCADVIVVASPVYFYGVSAQLKAIIDRLHTPMRNDFKVKKLALILVGAAVLPELFDSIKIQYQLVLNFFKLEDAGMVLVRGAKDKGDVRNTDGLNEAYRLGVGVGGGEKKRKKNPRLYSPKIISNQCLLTSCWLANNTFCLSILFVYIQYLAIS